jgi:hypothetical protein
MIRFKFDSDIRLFHCLHPALIMIFADLANYAQKQYGIDLVVTETITTPEQDFLIGRTSKAHQECRAIDIRTKDIDIFIVEELLDYINNKREYFNYHYEAYSGKKRLAFLHTTNEQHIHLAIHSQYAVRQ